MPRPSYCRLANAQVTPDEVAYVEVHGTGTALGLIRLKWGRWVKSLAPNARHRSLLARSRPTLVIWNSRPAGFIKTVLALQHQQIPPHLHFPHAKPVHRAGSGLPHPCHGAPALAATAGSRASYCRHQCLWRDKCPRGRGRGQTRKREREPTTAGTAPTRGICCRCRRRAQAHCRR